MATIGRITREGSILLSDELNERYPSVTDGLVSYFPLDGVAGAIDVVRGMQSTQHSGKEVNILEAMSADFNDPASWEGSFVWDPVEQALTATGSLTTTSSHFIAVDTSKHWYFRTTVKASNTSRPHYFGMRFYDANFAEIGTGVHYGTFDYTGFNNRTFPDFWDTYTNDAIAGAAKTGEGATGASVFHTGTKYIKLLLLPCYGGTGCQLWVKDIEVFYTDTDISEVSSSSQGTGIVGTTTNQLTFGDFNSFDGWACNDTPGPVTRTMLPGQGFNCRNAVRISKGVGSSAAYFQIQTTFPEVVVAGTSYTASIKYRAYEDATFSIGDFAGPDGNHPSWSTLFDVEIEDGWRWKACSYTYTNGGAAGFPFGVNSVSAEKTIVFCDFQLEKKPYATPFVMGTHSRGTLTFPITTTTTYSLSFEFTPLCANSYSGAVNWVAAANGDNSSLLVWKRTTEDYYRLRTNGPSTDYTFSNTDIVANNRYTVTLVSNGSSTLVYLNGLYKTTIAAVTSLTSLALGHDPLNVSTGMSIFGNLAIYNRALTADEVLRLANSRATMTTAGGIIADGTVEERCGLSAGTYYLPLSGDGYDTTRLIAPYDSSNLAYDDGAVWVGGASTNLFSPNTLSEFIVYSAGYATLGQYGFLSTDVVTISDVSANTTLYSPMIAITYNSTYTVGVKFRKISGTPTFKMQLQGLNAGGYIRETIWTADLQGYAQDVDGWQQLYYTFTFTDNTITLLRVFFQDGEDSTGYTHAYQLKDPVLVNRSFLVPHDASSSAGSLTYNLNSSINLDWSSNWTICYWKKPLATYLHNFTGYSLESIGASTAAYYGYWGKADANDIYVFYTKPTLQALSSIGAAYFNEWQFIAIRCDGANVYFNVWGADGVAIVNDTGVAPATATDCVTAYGYDFKLGGWNGGNPSNAYYRDLTVTKNFLTDDQLAGVHAQAKMRRFGLTTPTLIEEGM